MDQSVYVVYVKKPLDLVIALLLLVIAGPVMLFCALLIMLEDHSGPVLFRQERIGRGGRVFSIIKFRSMRVETHQGAIRLPDSARLLKVGALMRKLSLDELPQLLNIIRGEMSFIGPRPLPVRYARYFTQEENMRHVVLPGITGLAQVKGRNLMAWEKRFALDVYYVSNMSVKLDLKILLLTALKVVKREGIVLKEDNPIKDLNIERRDWVAGKPSN